MTHGRQRKPQKDQFICNLYSILAFPSCALYVCTHANTHNLHVKMCVSECMYMRLLRSNKIEQKGKRNNKNVRILGTCSSALFALCRSDASEAEISSRRA